MVTNGTNPGTETFSLSASLLFPIACITLSTPCLYILYLSVQQSPGFWNRPAEYVGTWGINQVFGCLFWVLSVAQISIIEASLQPSPGHAELSPTVGRLLGLHNHQVFWFRGSCGEPPKYNLKNTLSKLTRGIIFAKCYLQPEYYSSC